MTTYPEKMEDSFSGDFNLGHELTSRMRRRRHSSPHPSKYHFRKRKSKYSKRVKVENRELDRVKFLDQVDKKLNWFDVPSEADDEIEDLSNLPVLAWKTNVSPEQQDKISKLLDEACGKRKNRKKFGFVSPDDQPPRKKSKVMVVEARSSPLPVVRLDDHYDNNIFMKMDEPQIAQGINFEYEDDEEEALDNESDDDERVRRMLRRESEKEKDILDLMSDLEAKLREKYLRRDLLRDMISKDNCPDEMVDKFLVITKEIIDLESERKDYVDLKLAQVPQKLLSSNIEFFNQDDDDDQKEEEEEDDIFLHNDDGMYGSFHIDLGGDGLELPNFELDIDELIGPNLDEL